MAAGAVVLIIGSLVVVAGLGAVLAVLVAVAKRNQSGGTTDGSDGG